MVNNMSELVLFYKPTCSYCQKVLGFMRENDISLQLKDLSESADVRAELIAIGGKQQVPCLVIDGKALYESDDIIAWLKNNGGKNDRS